MINYYKSILFFIAIFSISCYPKTPIIEEDSNQNSLIKLFKYHYFTVCLSKGYDKSNAINSILAEETRVGDFSLGLKNYKYIDSLAEETRQFIKQDSIMFYKRWIQHNEDFKADKLTGKRTILHCLKLLCL